LKEKDQGGNKTRDRRDREKSRGNEG